MASGGMLSTPAAAGQGTAHRSQRLAAALVFAVGAVVLSGWLLRIPMLTRLHPSFVTMKANTAVGLMMLGGVLWLQAAPGTLHSWRSKASRALAATTAVLGLTTLSAVRVRLEPGHR
jgi:hypothetical protein